MSYCSPDMNKMLLKNSKSYFVSFLFLLSVYMRVINALIAFTGYNAAASLTFEYLPGISAVTVVVSLGTFIEVFIEVTAAITSINYRILLTVLLLLYTRVRSMRGGGGGGAGLSKLCLQPRFIVAIVVIVAVAAAITL